MNYFLADMAPGAWWICSREDELTVLVCGPFLTREAAGKALVEISPNWIKDVFKPLPEDEAKLLRDYGP